MQLSYEDLILAVKVLAVALIFVSVTGVFWYKRAGRQAYAKDYMTRRKLNIATEKLTHAIDCIDKAEHGEVNLVMLRAILVYEEDPLFFYLDTLKRETMAREGSKDGVQ